MQKLTIARASKPAPPPAPAGRHKLLERQIRRYLGSAAATSPELLRLLDAIDRTYRGADEDRRLLEHSLETVSQELADRFRMLQEEELRNRTLVESERLGAILDGASIGISVVDMDGVIIRTNAAFERMLGYAKVELIGRPSASLSPASEAVVTREALRALRAGERPSVDVEKRFIRRDGQVIVASLTLSLGLADDGQPRHVVGIMQDITERKRIQAALRESEEALRQAQKMEAVGQLAGGIAHDFNNLLTVIGGHAEALLSCPSASGEVREDAREIAAAADRASGLTRQLLAFSRKQLLQLQPTSCARVVKGMEPMLRRLIDAHIDVVVAGDSRRSVLMDPGQLEQVVLNLALNARDAMPDGGTLRITTADERVTNSAGHGPPRGDYVVLRVSDNGVGMDEGVRARVFEPFFTTKEPGRGTGLGLSTVYGIVAQSNAHIHLDSAPGQGTTFTLHLPAHGLDADLDDPAATAAPAVGGRATVLLVEDECALRRLARRALERAGYDVLEAAHGAEALDIADRQVADIDLLVTDIVMPNVNGCDLARSLDRVRPGLPVLFMSGYTDDEMFRRGLLEEGTAFLQKPFGMRDLLRSVRERLDAAATRAPLRPDRPTAAGS